MEEILLTMLALKYMHIIVILHVSNFNDKTGIVCKIQHINFCHCHFYFHSKDKFVDVNIYQGRDACSEDV